MCGIFGSLNVSKFEILDKANKVRGNFAEGIFYCDHESYDIQKTEGSFDWNRLKIPANYIYLGHNQAPTSTERDWDFETSHPFECGNWIVAHNGVLTNYKELIKKWLPDHDNAVDSSVIPALLSMYEDQGLGNLEAISVALSQLKGTFGLWIVNTKNDECTIYLARQGSTLFYDHNSFSSIKGDTFEEIKEGVIYQFGFDGIKVVGVFKSQSPFLEL